MSAVLSAFVQYIITFILLVAAAAGGIFCGKCCAFRCYFYLCFQ